MNIYLYIYIYIHIYIILFIFLRAAPNGYKYVRDEVFFGGLSADAKAKEVVAGNLQVNYIPID